MPFPTPILRASTPSWPQYKSPYAPKYQFQPHLFGFTPKSAFGLTVRTGAYGAVALFAVIYYASGIPRVQKDVLQRVPLLRDYFTHEIAPEDNPF
ncbi:hypothetical protein NKR23_g9275 [Pleurostoma richardsiae]|uniref:Cytochrome b-c1 complex subunit 10 n=1 Tax=Pleurostoma richardsiae TaxID=41990 RepID=A0AA38RNI4_9PEZI|nr:hypothetical protein NKR23_g9275 [Pleurostoma richardsiae]